MNGFLVSLAAFIVAISVLVAVHEFGHYLVGRLCGMKVLRFSIGFGKPLVKRVWGRDRTEYCISALPLGGYVRFLDERDGAVAEADRGRAFNHRPIPARIAVLLAGPGFNFLFAAVAYWALFVNGVPTAVPAVGQVTPDSYAAGAGLQSGDRILQVDGREVSDWESALVAMLDQMVARGEIRMTVRGEDGGERRVRLSVGADRARLTEPGLLFEGLGFRPWQPPAVVGGLEEAGPAAAAGIAEGDRITAIDGEAVSSFADLQRVVAARPAERVDVTVLRDGRERSFSVELGRRDTDAGEAGFLGVSVDPGAGDYWYMRQFGPLAAIGEAVERTVNATGFTVRMLARMVTGDVSIKNISGPINIAQYAGDSALAGLNAFLNFLALVSISLAVLNLLPVPILDGGQIVYQTIELVKGSPLSEKAQLVGQQVGILALLLLMTFAFYNDIARILGQ